MPKHFLIKKENFICDMCSANVQGTGYTNHCPNCLWSKHVDEAVPGDRRSNCKELMKPVGIDKKKERYVLIHKCRRCGKVSRNKVSEDDSFEAIVEIAKKR